MGRPAIVSTDQILQAARELFLEQGFGVTTAAIARRAGISEGSIFKRFPSKEALFFAALGIPEPTWVQGMVERAGKGEVKETLVAIMLVIIDFFQELLPRTSMMWSCRSMAANEQNAFWAGDRDTPPSRGVRALAAYFAEETRLGRLHVENPEVAARILLGSAQNYVFCQMFGVHLGSPLSATDFARSVVELLLGGLRRAS